MKLRIIAPVFVTACVMWLGCSSHASSSDEAPYAYAPSVGRMPLDAGVANTGVVLPTFQVPVNWSARPTFIADDEVEGTLVLSALATLLSTFIANGQFLDVTKEPNAIAGAIAANATATLCPSGSATYPAAASYVTVNFGTGCTLGGTGPTASGTILVALTSSSSGTPWVAVAFTLLNVGINGYSLTGSATISTDGITDVLDTRFAIAGLGKIAFHGATTSDGLSVTLDGAGTWAGTATPPSLTSATGWQCIASPASALDIHNLHKASSKCYADSGSVEVSSPYACTKPSDAGASTLMTEVSSASVAFLPTTPAAGNVKVTLTAPQGAGATGGVTTQLPTTLCGSGTAN